VVIACDVVPVGVVIFVDVVVCACVDGVVLYCWFICVVAIVWDVGYIVVFV
jgi:hypothetical protein